ncbi:Nucleosome assembly protein 1-like 1 [Halotydeus destructor]|nr:Nucleosome assembly protein 1-like 1 [Halotydeus destructor]
MTSPSKKGGDVGDVEAGEEVDTKQLGALTAQMMNNPEALAMMQQKLQGMVGTLSGYYDTLPAVVKRRVKALKKLQVDTLKIEAKLQEEIHALECKYAEQFEPLYKKRQLFINGAVEPTDAEADFPSDTEEDEESNKESKEEEKKEEPKEDPKGIPEFWLTTFKNVEVIGENIQESDEPILAHLNDVVVKQQKEPMGFTLEFHFSTNEYFTNEVLTKHYEMKCSVDETDPFSFEGPEITKCKGCEINWHKGKNVTVRTVTKKQKHKSKGSVRTVTKTVQNDSFFNFFTPPAVPEKEEDMDEEIQALLAADFEIGEVIRQRLVQRAVLYFTGEALIDEEDYDDEEDEEDFDEDEDDEDEDDDFEPPAKGGKKRGKGSKEKPQECQQQ